MFNRVRVNKMPGSKTLRCRICEKTPCETAQCQAVEEVLNCFKSATDLATTALLKHLKGSCFNDEKGKIAVLIETQEMISSLFAYTVGMRRCVTGVRVEQNKVFLETTAKASMLSLEERKDTPERAAILNKITLEGAVKKILEVTVPAMTNPVGANGDQDQSLSAEVLSERCASKSVVTVRKFIHGFLELPVDGLRALEEDSVASLKDMWTSQWSRRLLRRKNRSSPKLCCESSKAEMRFSLGQNTTVFDGFGFQSDAEHLAQVDEELKANARPCSSVL